MLFYQYMNSISSYEVLHFPYDAANIPYGTARTLYHTIPAAKAQILADDRKRILHFNRFNSTVFPADSAADTAHLAGIFRSGPFVPIRAFYDERTSLHMKVNDFLGTGLHTKTASHTFCLVNLCRTIFVIEYGILSAGSHTGGAAHTSIPASCGSFASIAGNICSLFRKLRHHHSSFLSYGVPETGS